MRSLERVGQVCCYAIEQCNLNFKHNERSMWRATFKKIAQPSKPEKLHLVLNWSRNTVLSRLRNSAKCVLSYVKQIKKPWLCSVLSVKHLGSGRACSTEVGKKHSTTSCLSITLLSCSTTDLSTVEASLSFNYSQSNISDPN